MQNGPECTMGRIEKSKFMIKPSCKNQKFTCAHIFWDFMLNQVRQGLMTYEDLMASIKGLSPCNETCGTGGGSGGKAVYGYTGTSPPDSSKNLWTKSFLSIAATFLLGFMVLFVACKSEQIGSDPKDRTATVWIKGNADVKFDGDAAKDSLNQIQDLKKLYTLADGLWNHHDPETSRSVMAWLVGKIREVEEESYRVFGKNLIDGDGTWLNPSAINDEDREYLEGLNFKVIISDKHVTTYYLSGATWRDFNFENVVKSRDSVDQVELVKLIAMGDFEYMGAEEFAELIETMKPVFCNSNVGITYPKSLELKSSNGKAPITGDNSLMNPMGAYESDSTKAVGWEYEVKPVVKEDVIIEYDLNSINNCDDTNNWYREVFSREKIKALKDLPTTGNIIPRVYCEDARGPPIGAVKRMLDSLEVWKPDLTFEPDNMHVTRFYPEDSIRADLLFNLKLTRERDD